MSIDVEYRVYIVKMPGTVHGAVSVDNDGFASIYINDSLSHAEQYKTLKHELRHLRRNDIYSLRSIRQIEKKPKRRNKKCSI